MATPPTAHRLRWRDLRRRLIVLLRGRFLADLEVIARAREGMNAWGYGDLMAKVVAGADWILADAAGAEPIDPPGLGHGAGAAALVARLSGRNCGLAIPSVSKHLVHGLVMSGFAMQAVLNSRPASGAEHQFSHLWDMQHHTFEGQGALTRLQGGHRRAGFARALRRPVAQGPPHVRH